jgi:uncharacterized protein (TIGR03435 family)
MKEHELDDVLDRGFTRHGEPSHEQVTSDLARIRERLEIRGVHLKAEATTSGNSAASGESVASFTRKDTGWLPIAAAAVLVLGAAIGTAIVWLPSDTAMHRVVEGDVYQGETIRSNGGGGAVLALADGSRIEMRSNTELALDRADDGVRIRLSQGGIIVNAVKQRSGHLYVQTKDMTVSVVGTVFVVNAVAEGSRVAVIEGEVRVQQGGAEQKLRPGDQVTTNPQMEPVPVATELLWSRRAEALTALLERQSAREQRPASVAAAQAPKEPEVAFEVITIRPSAPAAAAAPGARGGGGGLNSRPAPSGCVFDSFGYSHQIDPRRFAVIRTTLLHLAAYTMPVSALQGPGGRRPDLNCDVLTKVGLVSGGPDWIRSDVWDVVASIPEGTFSSTPALSDPVLQQMLRTMLSERFGLVVRHETRDVPVYLLKVGKEGPKFNGPSPRATNRDPARGPVMMLLGPDGKPMPAASLPPPPNGAISVIGGFLFGARNVTTTFWANNLFGLDGRPVLDRTGLTGRYDFHYEDPAGRPRGVGARPDVAALNRAVVKAMGFELEAATAPFDAWVIERAEKPTEN